MWKIVSISAAMLLSASSSFAQIAHADRGYFDLGDAVAAARQIAAQQVLVVLERRVQPFELALAWVKVWL